MTGNSGAITRATRASLLAVAILLVGLVAMPAHAQLERVVADAKGIT